MIDWLAGWYNWPFLFPMAVAVIFILFDLLLGGLSDLIGVSADFDADVDADLDVDADVDGDAPEIGAHGGHGSGAFLSGLMWLGLGKVPISIVLEVLFISFGGTGLLVNALWSEVSPESVVWLSLPVALIAAATSSLFITKWTAVHIAKLVPSDGTISRGAGGFLGEAAVVVVTVTATSGQVRVEGRGQTPDTVLSVKLDSTVAEAKLARGSQVVLMDYIEEKNAYTVTPMEKM